MKKHSLNIEQVRKNEKPRDDSNKENIQPGTLFEIPRLPSTRRERRVLE